MQGQAVSGHLYGDPEGYALRSEIAARHACRIENVVLASGIDELLMLFCRAYAAPGELAMTTHGSYPTFEYALQSVGGKQFYVNYLDDGRVDLEGMAWHTKEEPIRLVYIANPDNPTGTWQSPAAIGTCHSQISTEVLVLLDEAYADFAPEVAPFDPSDPHLVRLRTFSKGHGMAGIRIGYALCHEEHVRTLNKVRMHFGVSSVAQAGALASLQDSAHLERVVAETAEVRAWLRDRFAALGFESLESWTNFLTVRMEPKLNADEVLSQLREKGVFIRKPMKAFADHIRISIGPRSVMEEFVRRFETLL